MQKHKLKVPLTALCALLGLLVMAPIASANLISGSTAECTLVNNVPTIEVTIKFVQFADSNKPVNGSIKLDGLTVKTYTKLTWSGPDHPEIYTQATTPGDHSIFAAFTWPTGHSGNFSKIVPCPTPTVTPPPDTPPTVVPPAVVPPAVVPPAVVPPAVVPPAGGGVLPAAIASGQARLRGPSGCVKQAFKARVNGRSVASVAFYLDGKLLKRFTNKATTYSIKVNPRRYGFGRHRLVAKVTFVAASGTKSRTLPLTFRRCAQGAVAPRFTG